MTKTFAGQNLGEVSESWETFAEEWHAVALAAIGWFFSIGDRNPFTQSKDLAARVRVGMPKTDPTVQLTVNGSVRGLVWRFWPNLFTKEANRSIDQITNQTVEVGQQHETNHLTDGFLEPAMVSKIWCPNRMGLIATRASVCMKCASQASAGGVRSYLNKLSLYIRAERNVGWMYGWRGEVRSADCNKSG